MAHQQVRTPQPLLKRCTSATSLVALLVIGGVSPAYAEPHDPIPPVPHNWGYAFGARQPGHHSTHIGRSSPSTGERKSSRPEVKPICGTWRAGIQGCSAVPPPDDGKPTAPTVSPAELAAQAWRSLRIPAPRVATAPPRRANGLVGLGEWFWVTNWKSHSSRVEAGNVWAAVTARPIALSIAPGAGSTVRCAGPGTAYDGGHAADGQHSDCSYTYTRSSAGLPGSAYRVMATVTWGGTWVGAGTTGGSLPALTRSTTFPLRIAEGEAVTGG